MSSGPSQRNLLVLVGGKSGEHAISLLSGAAVVRHLDLRTTALRVVRVEQDGRWTFVEGTDVAGPGRTISAGEGIAELARLRPDVAFPVMHGPYGEDGHVQALLELLEIPFVGSGMEASALAMNKARARDVLFTAGARVAAAEELSAGQAPTIPAPCVVKPLRLGSSVGLAVVHTDAERDRAVALALAHDRWVLVEAFVHGTEVTAGVLERPDGSLEALPLVEIRPKSSHFFDYHAKYTPGASEELCPAPVPDAARDACQQLALLAHRVLGCRTMSRTDLILPFDGSAPVVLETNTIPGLTGTSLLPQAAAAAGIDFRALVERLVGLATRPR